MKGRKGKERKGEEKEKRKEREVKGKGREKRRRGRISMGPVSNFHSFLGRRTNRIVVCVLN